MTRNLLLSAAAVACLAWPALAFADPPTDQTTTTATDQDHQDNGGDKGQTRGDKGGSHGQGNASDKSAAPAAGGAGKDVTASAPGPEAPKGARAQAFDQNGTATDQVQAPVRAPTATVTTHQRVQAFQPGGDTSASQSTSTRGYLQTPQPQPGQLGAGQRQTQARRAMQPPAGQSVLSRWNPTASGPARDQAGQQWRQTNAGWDSRTPWRGDTNWWRDNSAFSGFAGVRIGFFFIPEFGYVSAPAEYRDREWRSGEELPSWFWRYAIRDYWNYGLPQPPDDCEWVWVNDGVALIDRSDGYILEIQDNVW